MPVEAEGYLLHTRCDDCSADPEIFDEHAEFFGNSKAQAWLEFKNDGWKRERGKTLCSRHARSRYSDRTLPEPK